MLHCQVSNLTLTLTLTLTNSKVMKQFLPRYLGVKVIEGDRYLELESLQSHFDPATSITIAIKMGFKTFRPDAKRMDIPKKMYYIKDLLSILYPRCARGRHPDTPSDSRPQARKHCEHLLTPAEHAAREVTQARWLSMKDDETSSSTAGFCIDGVRIKHEIVPLDSLSRTTSVFDSILRRGGVTKELLALVVWPNPASCLLLANADPDCWHPATLWFPTLNRY